MSQKSVLITGTSEGGIGDAIAQEFHAQGLRVFASARDLKKIQHLADKGFDVIKLDVLDAQSIAAAVEAIKTATNGKLDYLVNNAGSGYQSFLLDTDMDVAKKVFDLNVWSVIGMSQAFAPLLIAAQGTIVNISSISGKQSMPTFSAYGASKAAVERLSQGMRHELSPFGVQTVNIITGVVKTNFHDNMVSLVVPESSIYYPIREEAADVVAERPGAMDRHVYAKVVVKQLLRPTKPAEIWAGGYTNPIWLLSTFLTAKFADALLLRDSGMKNLSALGKVQLKKS